MFGVDHFDAILPPGTGAIMAVGASQPTAVATKDGGIGVKSQMQVNVTADLLHCLSDASDNWNFIFIFAIWLFDALDICVAL
ncbi:dihydrolipoyllysine-residue acetyltransferase component 5 of pyruvate dehydrogenase complex, chloroplastic-like [Magnolia sinica]|uniref:dihydrolipoyllysine-residue acetyltransferase component 5 of pyruvate dehydrogenase complex, chloroplastic-like n=1 Tax=Magnolia sinica TaxID=86752 RepID=UPI002658D40B|nr:dihydrolipoyllysine-residue acetyltransferase component 5 of pyruvate dehydrogenase complex, chloroplastic-like [Magnolia sinica]XP_058079824.1 dihydrolipoyllysine-residue acetyltransferase component 5 of pyruvate dehydrogenase complex, chloroplastic-like [Magnolia sinica]